MMPSVHDIQPIVIVVGTRPEGIKMIPLYYALRDANLPVVLCSTMQHDELLTQVFDLFDIKPDYDLRIMRQGQDLFYLTQSILQKTKEVFKTIDPSLVLVQGDTTSTMAAALSAFYLHIPVVHIEAGLRTDDIRAPFPEEMNRRVVGTVADIHCAPTAHAAAQLYAQGVERSKVFCTGNTVVDALRIIQNKLSEKSIQINADIKKMVQQCKKENKKIMLLTAHRRESFDGGIVRVLQTVKEFLSDHPEVFCFYPYHPNPNVIQAIKEVGLSSLPNIFLTEPVAYKELAYLLLNLDWVVTDSGGIQEEAVSLSKPVLVLREKTERAEGVWAGFATMVGTDSQKIKNALENLVQKKYKNKSSELFVYGDGYAAEKIVNIIKDNINLKKAVDKKEKIKKTDQVFFETKRESAEKTVAVLGLGYIGLPTSIVMAQSGISVVGFDIDQKRVDAINAGDPVIQEPEIFEKLQLVLGSGHFCATTKLQPADYFIIAVPTPFKEEKKADLSYVFAAADSIASVLQKGNCVLLESTVPVRCTEQLAQHLENKTGMKAGIDFYVAHCPERVLPGKIFYELVHNTRIIGGINKQSVQKAKELYQIFVKGSLYLTDSTTAEMVKLVENSSRDVQIAFAHQVASMAKSVNLDPYEVIELANKHPRVNILQPSCGVGGHCIAVDPWFLVESFPSDSILLKTARNVNDSRPAEIVELINSVAARWEKENKKRCNVLALGLTYKPNVDDLRESPAIEVVKSLSKNKKIKLMVSEPHINKKNLQKLFKDRVVSVQDGIDCADVIVYLVAHKRFRAIDEKMLANKKIIDVCGLWHEPKKHDGKQECMFWPASKLDDPCHLDQRNIELTKHEKETHKGDL